MIIIKGKYNEAIIYTDTLEDTAYNQIQTLCNQEFTNGSRIRIMPDVHAGAGCTIGTTMSIKDKAVPNLVGVDIGCGVETIQIKNKHIELEKLDKLIYEKIPSGFKVRENAHRYNEDIDLNQLKCLGTGKINIMRAEKSLGTLGGGNHFIEVDKDEEGKLYFVVHSGSRHLGLEVANYYQNKAYNELEQSQVKMEIPKPLAYVEGQLFEDYIHDMKIVQRFALLNRKAIMDELIRGMKLKVVEEFTTIHNYIDIDDMILRKGAVSAKEGEKLIIPINMRDGSLICIGKGNEEWNCSAPHGAGRLMSRSTAKNSYTVSEFKKQMKGIYSTSIKAETLDECPMAYKNMDDIINNISETVIIKNRIKPVYNFKAGEE
ncbi:RtcB family protein [Anaerosacchariphilus polymeriproducens]|uniref:3'-phosphate/5'-hydroxy nucleic acid ligase n=1 Tax=Anaerosacchariphilus polymeriproducens TaxID=1812858 RepID=A0A371AZ12_9FIRM|nr:RtcB family protein [Anaerosacchariphilus polymeriproducens]RDU24742.1 RtcB family protein [Anaerosacchariphilus polymeriproducens]